MGLDFTHDTDPDGYSTCCPSWPYSAFMRFRRRLAACEGITLDDMRGFSGERPCREWSEFTTPLKPLLDHSDCDGDLSPEDCATVAARLRQIVEHWPEDDHDRQKALDLSACMEKCATEGVSLEFC